MIDGLGRAGTTALHRLPAGVKLVGLAVLATALFLIEDAAILAGAALVGLAAALSTGVGAARLVRLSAWPLALIGAVGVVDWWLVDAATALTVVPRLVALAFFAQAVTLTTTTGELTAALEAALAPLERIGLVDARRVALTLTLAVRFVPLIVEEAREIREAQAARGLSGHPLALIVPLVVRVLVRAEEVTDSIDARGFPPRRNINM
ncbi:MAG: CbiQ family ECF transporter T component [Siculibacillus sp.]